MTRRHRDRVPEVARRYAREVHRRLGRHVRELILFGSHARGDASVASDYDFIVVLDRADRALREAILDAGVKMLDDENALCAALVYGPDQWERVKESPLGWNVQQEGIEL